MFHMSIDFQFQWCKLCNFFILDSICIENLKWLVHWFHFNSFFTSCLLIPVWVQLESTSTFSHSSFLFNILILVFNFFSLLSHWYRIIYWFCKLLYTEIYHIISISNFWQNSFVCCYFHYLNLSIYFCSLSFVLIYNLLLSILLYYIYNTSWSFFSP